MQIRRCWRNRDLLYSAFTILSILPVTYST